MKTLISIFGFLNGGFMLLDGIFVMLKGKYIGPEKPGPWANLFYKVNIDVFSLGPLFIAFGVMWLVWISAFLTGQWWAWHYGLIVSALTMWYLPVGTICSVAIFVMLL